MALGKLMMNESHFLAVQTIELPAHADTSMFVKIS